MEQQTLEVKVITHSQVLYSGLATMVVVPSVKGYVGILPDHIPLIALMQEGTIDIVLADSQTHQTFDISGGVCSMLPTGLTLFVG